MLNIKYYTPPSGVTLQDAFRRAGFQTKYSSICDMLFLEVFLLRSYNVSTWLGLSSKRCTEEIRVCSLWRGINGIWEVEVSESDEYYAQIIKCLESVTIDIEINLTIHKAVRS